MGRLLDNLVGRLPAQLRPYAKALVPLALATAAALTDLSLSGAEFRQLAEVAGGALTGLLVAATPNKP